MAATPAAKAHAERYEPLGEEDTAPYEVQPPKASEESGMVIGNFVLVRKVGEGGMGMVWEAEQKVPIRRRVALKLIQVRHGHERVRETLRA